MKNSSSRTARGKGDNIKTNGWMTTFSDLCTLLLTFFVLLFSISSMDDRKLKIAFQNFAGSSGFLSFKEYRAISRPKEILITGLSEVLGEKVVIGKEEGPPDANIAADVDTRDLKSLGGFLVFQPLKEGFKLIFGDKLLFSAGNAEIGEEMKPVLEKIAKFISISGYQVYVDGHTDNISVHSAQYASNEDLSIARALNVRNYLVRLGNIRPDSIALIGYGALKPVASNDLPGGKERNRRVEIVLKDQKYF
jgi:chemotaxis protein MotB